MAMLNNQILFFLGQIHTKTSGPRPSKTPFCDIFGDVLVFHLEMTIELDSCCGQCNIITM